MYDKDRTIHLFRCLPDIKTGANLTLTILTRMFNMRLFDRAVDVYINWDGSRDNVNYTCYYALVHFLIRAERAGWPLRTITLMRLQVRCIHPHPLQPTHLHV